MNNREHPAHRAVKDALMGPLGEKLLTNFYLGAKLWKRHWERPSLMISYRPIEEYPIVTKSNRVKVNGKSIYNTIFVDFVFVVEPGPGAIGCNECVYIGVEIKSSLKDIAKVAEQMSRYCKHADYWFLAVPGNLIDAATLCFRDSPWIGICSYETGEIYKQPERIYVPDENRITMLHRLVFCPFQETKHIFYPDYKGTPYDTSPNVSVPHKSGC